VARPLRKRRKSGSLYFRRTEVESEILVLEQQSSQELLRLCAIGKDRPGFVSTEALLYLVRNTVGTALHESLVKELLRRFSRLLPRVENADGVSSSMTNIFIRDEVNDSFIQNLVADFRSYNDGLDYYEVNFNHAVSLDKRDAKDKYWRHENRQIELGTEEDDADEDGSSNTDGETYNPFDAEEMDKKNYRRRLDDAIEELPDIQRRIVEMVKQEIPIESKDESIVTISKALQKSEKTIRNQRDKAYSTLRKKLQFPGRNNE
jgi:hypothetical protein